MKGIIQFTKASTAAGKRLPRAHSRLILTRFFPLLKQMEDSWLPFQRAEEKEKEKDHE
jgi:hypothetical protein